MQNSNRLEHPVLDVSLPGGGGMRPSSFYLITDAGLPSVMARLRYPAGTAGKPGDQVTVSLTAGEKYTLFTGEVYSAAIHGAYRDLDLTDGYKKLCDTFITAAYRKETAEVILKDTLEQAGIEKTAITCPAVEIARFSTEKIPADMCVKHLIKALEEHGHRGLRFFFDEKNTFRFGTAEDTGKNEGPLFAFETGKNILSKWDGCIEVMPFPIRHLQPVSIDGVELVPRRTELSVSGSRSRLVLWFGGAV